VEKALLSDISLSAQSAFSRFLMLNSGGFVAVSPTHPVLQIQPLANKVAAEEFEYQRMLDSRSRPIRAFVEAKRKYGSVASSNRRLFLVLSTVAANVALFTLSHFVLISYGLARLGWKYAKPPLERRMTKLLLSSKSTVGLVKRVQLRAELERQKALLDVRLANIEKGDLDEVVEVKAGCRFPKGYVMVRESTWREITGAAVSMIQSKARLERALESGEAKADYMSTIEPDEAAEKSRSQDGDDGVPSL
jgi:hypothetical protein